MVQQLAHLAGGERDGESSSPPHNQGKCGPLHGSCQTSQRADVRALVAALEVTVGDLQVVTDSQYVQNKFLRVMSNPSEVYKGKHVDLWKRIAQHTHRRITIFWI